MRLTAKSKQTFINAVRGDIPTPDFQARIQKVATDYAVSKLPPKVLALWKDKDLRHFVNTVSIYVGCDCVGYLTVPAGDKTFKLSQEALDQMEAICKERDAFAEKARDILYELRVILDSCRTRKQALEKLDEDFHKYLPGDEAVQTTNLPSSVLLRASLKRLGWPGDKQEKAA